MSYRYNILLLFLLSVSVKNVYASVGDGSWSFRKCLRNCESGCSPEVAGTG